MNVQLTLDNGYTQAYTFDKCRSNPRHSTGKPNNGNWAATNAINNATNLKISPNSVNSGELVTVSFSDDEYWSCGPSLTTYSDDQQMHLEFEGANGYYSGNLCLTYFAYSFAATLDPGTFVSSNGSYYLVVKNQGSKAVNSKNTSPFTYASTPLNYTFPAPSYSYLPAPTEAGNATGTSGGLSPSNSGSAFVTPVYNAGTINAPQHPLNHIIIAALALVLGYISAFWEV